MKIVKAILCLFFLYMSSAGASTTWNGKMISQLQPDHPSVNCFYFTLDGVSEADPIRPGVAWFAVDRDVHPGAKDLYAALLAARLSGSSITAVNTSGGLACGYAAVYYVIF